MSPVPTATPDQSGGRPAPVQPLPMADIYRIMAKEMVVDWQLSSDLERQN